MRLHSASRDACIFGAHQRLSIARLLRIHPHPLRSDCPVALRNLDTRGLIARGGDW